MFIDEARIAVCSGRGGDGAVHFHREKFVPRGGPDGGDGGRGGDVVLEVTPSLNTLSTFRHQARYKAEDGKRGGRNNMSGRSADDLVVLVPPGTLVYDDDKGELVGDMVTYGQRLVLVKGGRGGKGNQHYANSRNQAPRMAEKGEPAQIKNIRLELKLIADIGIVGVPNAGKSSFLAAVTNAKPKIADYPFTTLEPNIGVAELDADTTLVLADIPGLIEGAHLGTGLGFAFLRHIQRTRVIIHLLDGLAEDPLVDYSQICSELALFDAELSKKPQIVALNKMDVPAVAERWPEIKARLEQRGVQPMSISALVGTNVRQLLWKAAELLAQQPKIEMEAELPVYRPVESMSAFTLEHEPGGWRVKGAAIERSAAMTYWEFDDSVRHFQRLMDAIGVDDALRKAGIQEGETVFIGEYELEWQD